MWSVTKLVSHPAVVELPSGWWRGVLGVFTGESSVIAKSLLELKGPGCLNNTHLLSLSAYTANEVAGHPLSGPVSWRMQAQQGTEADACPRGGTCLPHYQSKLSFNQWHVESQDENFSVLFKQTNIYRQQPCNGSQKPITSSCGE